MVEGLSVVYGRGPDTVTALRDVDLTVSPGDKRALVGESGSGKTTLGRAIPRLLAGGGRVVKGSVHIDGHELTALRGRALARARRNLVGVVFQDPLNALDPLKTIGSQVSEAVQVRTKHDGRWSRRELQDTVRHVLEDCQLSNVERLVRQYPHELSGGMRQRVTIAMAVAGECRLLVADEPTTALDVVTQAGIVELIESLVRTRGMGLLFITHNLALASELCATVSIMYGGQIVEEGDMVDTLRQPMHPYTEGLLRAIPVAGAGKRTLVAIPGAPGAVTESSGCVFEPRCNLGHGEGVCRWQAPPVRFSARAAPRGLPHWGRCHFIKDGRLVQSERTESL